MHLLLGIGDGAFNGNRMLKLFIQYLVAAHNGIDLMYATKEDTKFQKKYIGEFLNKSHTIKELYDYILLHATEL